MSALSIRIAGLVQGVGFRPFVWRLAQQGAIRGSVWNDAAGVGIEAWGEPASLYRFLGRLHHEAPPLARIDTLTVDLLTGPAPADFAIRESRDGARSAGIVPDAATCPACRAEVADPANRRRGYAFTNCTHCGPRLSIVEAIPYDRANTSMRAFEMCAACAAEYRDPRDRRFHAQPNACPDCGPRLWLEDESGEVASDPIPATAVALAEGRIVAIKGIGGFHLACDACNPVAVAALRVRKHRDAKPFALMARAGDIAAFAEADASALAALASPAAPIVLLPARAGALPAEIAPDQDRLGVMLPYTPLHHLLLDAFGGPLVMTSGNRSEEPQVIDNAAARRDLTGIADLWLMHDRDIVNRLDDSVVIADPVAPAVLRRARGFAPAPLRLGPGFAEAPPVLAMGGDLKSTFCMLAGGQAVVSHHIGDLAEARTHGDYRRAVALYRNIYGFEPTIVAVDLHAGYHSTRFGEAIAAETGARLVRVQHHHAHLAATLAEREAAADAAPVSGWILDGLGMGEGGQLWGGEFLRADFFGLERVAHLPAVPLPGGDAASRQPWRNLVAHLSAAFGPEWRRAAAPLLASLPDEGEVRVIEQLIAAGTNAPSASSAGRLFDAVAAALGLAGRVSSFEGQAAMRLEAAARCAPGESVAYPIVGLDLGALWRAIAEDRAAAISVPTIAARFHATLAAMLADAVASAGPLVLSGGVFQNRLLAGLLRTQLAAKGVEAIEPRLFPANDGGLALGQAAIAAARSRPLRHHD